MFQLTPQAAAQIRSAALASGATTMALRVAAKRNADGDVVYTMGFDDANEGDTELSADGVRILISTHSAALLEDVELDYVELTPGMFNFIFVSRSNAATSKPAGGCGSGGCGGGGCSKQGNA
jgi:iron-sulfur cluster assembly protein